MAQDTIMVSTAQPKSQSRGPAISVRRYGWNDFESFDEEAARGSHLCVGSANIGKVDIDCKYHWKRAQWGVLGSEKRPAGIVYMDITFKQPRGYWLDRASVFVTLSEDSSSYATAGPRRSKFSFHKSDYAVQITEHYGPRFLTGAKTLRSEMEANHFVPTVSAMGIELGGMGRQSYTSKQRVGRWVFKGTVGKPRGGDGLRTLEWELSENALDPDQAHHQEYHTAFAFEHSQRPVFMRVEVEGKIRSKTRQLKHGLLQFSSQFGKKDNSTLTRMNFGKDVIFKKHLDQFAKGLDMAMQMENCESPPVVVPDPTPAQFTQGSRPGLVAGVTDEHSPAVLNKTRSEHQSLHHVTDRRHSSHRSHPASVTDHGRPDLGQGQLHGRWGVVQGQEEEQKQEEVLGLGEVLEDDNDNALVRSLRRRLQSRTGSDLAAHVHLEERKQSSGSESELPNGSNMTTTVVDSSASTHIRVPEAVEEDITQLIARIPVLLFFLRYASIIMKWLARPPPLPATPAREQARRDKELREQRDREANRRGEREQAARDEAIREAARQAAREEAREEDRQAAINAARAEARPAAREATRLRALEEEELREQLRREERRERQAAAEARERRERREQERERARRQAVEAIRRQQESRPWAPT